MLEMAETFLDYLVTVIHCAWMLILIEQLKSVESQGLDVISTQLPCPEVQRPPDNQRWCYRTTYSLHPVLQIYQCNAAVIDRTNQTVKFFDSFDNSIFTEDGITQTKLWSPNKIRGRNYQSNRYCLYKAVCPPGHFMYYTWLDGNFELEPEVDGRCLDFVLIESYDRPSMKLCGSQPGFVEQRSGPLEVTFRSNTPASTRYPGFQIDVLCVSPLFANLPNCTVLSSSIYSNMNEKGNPTNTSTTDGIHSTANVTEEANSTLQQARLKRQTTSYIPLTLSSINVPREVNILYLNNVVKLVEYGQVLRSFRNVNYFFFWTGFNGTRTFRRGAPKDVHIYGGGTLRVIKYLAFYYNFRIPPEYEPSRETIGVISMLLNATTPFFLDDDPPDVEPPPDPPTKKPPIRGTPLPPHSKRAAADVARKQQRRVRQTSIEPNGMDMRINTEALAMAEMLENACDVFLREASRSYLRILEEFGIRP